MSGGAGALDGLSDYELRNLVGHLHAAERAEQVHRLLRLEETSEPPLRGNAWFLAQERIENVDGYLGDVRLALELTRQESGDAAIALAVRYALDASSAGSVTSAVPAALVSAAVQVGALSLDAAIAQVARVTDPRLAAETLVALVPHTPPTRHDELRALAAGLTDPEAQVRALVGLAPCLAVETFPAVLADLGHLSRGWQDHELVEVLTALASRLDTALAEEALGLARRVERGTLQAEVLLALEQRLPESARPLVVAAALEAARSDPIHYQNAAVLASAIAALPCAERDDVREALAEEAIERLDEAFDPTAATGRPPDFSLVTADRLVSALRRAMTLDAWRHGPEALVELAPKVPDEQLGELLEVVTIDGGPGAREGQGTAFVRDHDQSVARVLLGLADRLPEELHTRALDVAAELQPDACALALVALAPHLRPALLGRAEALVLRGSPSPARCTALATLAVHQEDATRAHALWARAAEEAAGLDEPELRARAQLDFAAVSSGARAEAARRAAADAARQVRDPDDRVALLLETDGDLLPDAIAAARAAESSWKRIELLLRLLAAPVDVPDRQGIVRETLELIAQRSGDDFNPYPFAQLVELAPHLTALFDVPAAEVALAIDRNRRPGWGQSWDELAPFLGADGMRVLVEGAGEPSWLRAEQLEALAAWVPESLHAAVLAQAEQLDSDDAQLVLGAYAGRLSPALVRQALQLCRRIGDADLAAAAEVELVAEANTTPLPDTVVTQVFAVRDPEQRARLLARLAPLLSRDELDRVSELANASPPDSFERVILVAVLARTSSPGELGALVERVAAEERTLAAVLRAAPAPLPATVVERAAELAVGFEDRVLRNTTVATLAPALTPELRARLRAHARRLDPNDAVDLLLTLLPGADEATRDELLDAARSAAGETDSDEGTAVAYLAIAGQLDGEAQAEAFETALSWALVIELGDVREPVLEAVLAELVTVDPARALALSEHLSERSRYQLQTHAIAGLDTAAQAEVVREVVEVSDETRRAERLAALLDSRVHRGLDPAVAAQLREAAAALDDPAARVRALAALLGGLPAAEQPDVASELRRLAANRNVPQPSRMLALTAILAYGTVDQRATALAALLNERRDERLQLGLDNPPIRYTGLFRELAPAEQRLLWMTLFGLLADSPRPTILEALADLAKVVASAGERVTVETVDVIAEAARWWP
jgi:hypothetical protein